MSRPRRKTRRFPLRFGSKFSRGFGPKIGRASWKSGSSSPRDEWRTDNTNLFFFSFSHNSRKRKKHFELIDLGLIPRGIEEGSRGSINRCHRACDEFIDRAFHSRTTLNPGQVAAGRSFSSNEPMLERSEKIILFPSLVRFYVESNLWNG